MEECPYINHRSPDIKFNIPITYEYGEGGQKTYVFYDHIDPEGQHSNVQFCLLCGRKRDVFECLNINEWTACSYYLVAAVRKP